MNAQRDVTALDGLADQGCVQRAEVLAEDGDDVDLQVASSCLASGVGIQQAWRRVDDQPAGGDIHLGH
jgi:hypothetical protein